MFGTIRRHHKKLTNLTMALLFLGTQLMLPLLVFQPGTATAAAICTVDSAGANDLPGQKDLTLMCVDYAGIPNTVSTTWNWDELGASGANTLDACNLFDTDGDGNINYSVCVGTIGNPATFQSVTTYSCGDDKTDRCTSPTTPVSSGTTSCAVSQKNTDPFAAGSDAPKDTEGACTIQLSTVGGTSARLIDVCSYPSAQPNSDPSDCVIAREKAGKLEVRKNIIPSTNTGLFNLQIDGTTQAANISNNGTTGEVVVSAASHSVGETAGTNTNLSSYTAAVSCRDLNGTGAVIASGTTTTLASVPIADGADVICTITNTASGSITITKDAVPNSAQDFSFTATGNGVSNFSLDDDANATLANSRTFSSLAAGSYSFTESPTANWDLFSLVCDTTSGVTINGATTTINLTSGQNVACTYTNKQRGTITVNKITDPANDPTSFSITASGTGTIAGNANRTITSTQSVTYDVAQGTYAINELVPDGWALTNTTCGSVTVNTTNLNPTCTITNTKNARLTVNKVVTNDDGGTKVISDFPLFVNSSSVTSGVANQFAPGTYTVSETGSSQYAAVIGGDCSGLGVITLAAGETKICTITNDDIAPRLTVIKTVINDNGGGLQASNFTMNVSGTDVSNSTFSGSALGTTITLDAGAYNVDESLTIGYAKSLGQDCSGTIALAETKTCTITNDDIAPIITIIKTVENDSGGNAVVEDFPLFVGTVQVTSGTPTTFNAGVYVVSETNLAGYSASGWGGACATNGTITLEVGQAYTCTITNSDTAPTITLIKNIVNDDGGDVTDKNAFGLTLNGATVNSGSVNSVRSNTPHTISEAGLAGYAFTGISGDAKCPSVLNGTVTLDEGENITCTITNDDIAPTVTIIKQIVTNDPASAAQDFSFSSDSLGTFTLDDDTDSTLSDRASFSNLTNNQAYTFTENPTDGWDLTSLSCENGTTHSVNGTSLTVTPANGEDAVCTFTNTQRATVVITKDATPDDPQDFTFNLSSISEESIPNGDGSVFDIEDILGSEDNSITGINQDFSLDDDDDGALGNTAVSSVPAGQYQIQETDIPAGWDLTDIDCGQTRVVTNDTTAFVTVVPGETISCIFSNQKRGSVTIVKDALPNSTQAFIFTGNFEGEENSNFSLTDTGDDDDLGSRTFDNLQPGTYTVTEPSIKGWNLASIVCTDEEGVNVNERNVVISLAAGENITCIFTNEAVQPKLTVIKNVINDDGAAALASDFTLNVDGPDASPASFDGDPNGTTVSLSPGDYTVTEDPAIGYTARFSDDCTGTLELGDEKICTVTNDDNPPLLTILKSNDTPDATTVGDTVTYTMTITAPAEGGIVYNTLVTDLPPENFAYLSGSWTATSSVESHDVAGDISTNSPINEPTYGSPGDWFLGTLLPGEVITLTYRTLIQSVVSPGAYPDIAFVRGESNDTGEGSNPVVGNIHFAETPFVGTQVSVAESLAPSTFTAGEVLGASILVNTGQGQSILQLAIPFSLLTITLYLYRSSKRSIKIGAAK